MNCLRTLDQRIEERQIAGTLCGASLARNWTARQCALPLTRDFTGTRQHALDSRIDSRISRISKIVLIARLAAVPVGNERFEGQFRHRPEHGLALRPVDLLAG